MEKKRVLVVGCNGKMGQLLCKSIAESKDFKVVAGYDVEHKDGLYQFPTFCSIAELERWEAKNRTDVIFDFSRPEATLAVLEFAEKYGIAMVIATTGFDDKQEEKIRTAANHIWIFKSSNMAFAVNVMVQLLKTVAKLLPSYSCGISEIHHEAKADAPSGTVKMFFNAINDVHGNLVPKYGKTSKKEPNEVWIASQRIDGFPGEHTVTFGSPNDFIKIEHFAYNRSIFAEGALEAARFLLQQPFATLYSTEDMIANKLKK